MMRLFFVLFFFVGGLTGCASLSRDKPPQGSPLPEKAVRGGYYLDDGPGDNLPPNLQDIADAVPRVEPLHRFANRPYEVLGGSYKPLTQVGILRQEGVASWYGRRYHGKPTASGEIYDMYGMTAAHPTLPIPSYARVTSLDSGKSVTVRINDRGPFHSERVVDLSYTAAYKLGLLGRGSARVAVESIDPGGSAGPAIVAQSGGAQVNPSKSGYYVQLGAFGNAENAEKLISQVRAALSVPPELVQVAMVGELHRVNLGPFANQAEASDWVERTRAALGITAFTITR